MNTDQMHGFRLCLRSTVFICSWTLLFSCVVRADEQWILTTADFKSETVPVRSIDNAGIHIPGDAGERVVAMNQFLQLDRASQSRPTPAKQYLWLTDGDRLGGAP